MSRHLLASTKRCRVVFRVFLNQCALGTGIKPVAEFGPRHEPSCGSHLGGKVFLMPAPSSPVNDRRGDLNNYDEQKYDQNYWR